MFLDKIISLSGYRYLGDGGTDRREVLHDGTYRSRAQSLPFWGLYPQANPKIQNFGPLKAEYLQNGKSQHLTSARRELSKNV